METIAGVRQEHRIQPASTAESTVEKFISSDFTKPFWKKFDAWAKGPLPLIIGVTGHRDLRPADIASLEDAVRNEFERLQREYPATPLVLLSGLAEGADRLAARMALESGMKLIAVLPMPIASYETDFDSDSLKEFHSLLDAAEHFFEMPLMEGSRTEDLVQHSRARQLQYGKLGAHLVAHSTIMLALWDGIHLQKMGGTSQIVRFKLEGVPAPFAPEHSKLDAPDSGPVYQIVTPRESNPDVPADAYSVRRLYPEVYPTIEEAEKAFHDIYERMETLNNDAIRYGGELREHCQQSEEYLFPASLRAIVPTPVREIQRFYAIADVLSQRYQKRTFSVLRLLLVFVWLAAVFYELYSGLVPETPMMALYLGMFLCAYISYKWADRQGYQARYLDYRALAEGLRVQFFWKLAGIRESVADYYLRKQKSELEWIRNAVRSCMTETRADETEPRPLPDPERVQLVLKHWVEDQANYFSRAAHRDHENLHRQERKIALIFGAALALAVVQIVIGVPINAIILFVAVLPVAAALMNHYSEKNAYAEHKRQYTRMSMFYHRAKIHLSELISKRQLSEAQSFLTELGLEALVENGDWILTHRDRPLEVPKGG